MDTQKEERLNDFLLDFIEGNMLETSMERQPEPDIYKILEEEEEIKMYEVNLCNEEMEN